LKAREGPKAKQVFPQCVSNTGNYNISERGPETGLPSISLQKEKVPTTGLFQSLWNNRKMKKDLATTLPLLSLE
jgi:hypothetical protein